VPIGAVHGLLSGLVLNAALNIGNALVMFSIYAVNENGMVKPWELGEQQWTPSLFARIRTWHDLFIVTNYVTANQRPGFLRRYQRYASATGTLPTTGHLDAGEVARAWGEGDSAALFETFQRQRAS
jgi:hypothetical protein